MQAVVAGRSHSLQLRGLKGDPAKAAIRREAEPKDAALAPMAARSP